MIRKIIKDVVDGNHLTEQQMISAMSDVMNGDATSAQIASLITALRLKGETIEEITGAARVMRGKSAKIQTKHPLVVDTCGTGGDGSGTFNISTTAAFVVAGAGIPVAKHGNRAASSQCGSADVLSALGINIELTPKQVGACIDDVGIGFLFAVTFHGAMKYAIGPRQEIGIRTIFNILGPLTNPLGAQAQVIGVYTPELTEPLAHVLRNLGSRHAFVVHGADGLDEITLASHTRISELVDGNVKTYNIHPDDFGLSTVPSEALLGGTPQENAEIALTVLKGSPGSCREIVTLNAAAAIVAAGTSESIEEGLVRARESIDSGKALEKLECLKAQSNA